MASILLAYNEAEFLNGPLKIIPGKHIFIHLTYRALQSWHYFEHKSAILDFGILAKASSLLGEHGLIFGGQTQICAIRARHFHRGRLLRQATRRMAKLRTPLETAGKFVISVTYEISVFRTHFTFSRKNR